MTNRFHYLTGIGIEDDQTGHIYNHKQDITNLLNHINNKKNEYNNIIHTLKEYIYLKTLQLEDEDPNHELDTYKHIEDKLRQLMR